MWIKYSHDLIRILGLTQRVSYYYTYCNEYNV